MDQSWTAMRTSLAWLHNPRSSQHVFLGTCSQFQVLDRRKGIVSEGASVLRQRATYCHHSPANACLLHLLRRRVLRKERHWKCWATGSQKLQSNGRRLLQCARVVPKTFAMDEGADDFPSIEQYSDGEMSSGSSYSSSGEESDGEVKLEFAEEGDKAQGRQNELEDKTSTLSLTSPFYRVSTFQRNGFPAWVDEGILVTSVLFIFLAGTVVTVDSYIWKVIRRPLAHYFLTVPFCIAAAISAYFGCFCVPLLERVKAHQVFRKEGPTAHLSKVGTPTMGGLFFVPVGIGVARIATGFYSNELWGACVATLACAVIGLLDDGLALWRNHNYGLAGWFKFVLQMGWNNRWLLAFGLCFGSTIPAYHPLIKCVVASQPPGKTLVPLPPPFGLRYLGKWYFPLTAFCFAAMSNAVNLTDGLDGLAAGTAAAALIGMAVVVLPIYPGLGIFGASMAGACIGFLAHNRYKAKVFMGDTGSLALGGALAAMAACTGMFLPLFIASGVFVIETVSVIGQVLYFKLTKRLEGKGRRWLLMAPFHHHLELLGVREPYIIAAAYVVAYILAILAAYIGLISA